MFINNSKENWDLFRNAIHVVESKNRQNNTKPVVNRVEDSTNDLLREVERVSKASPEGNFTPAIIGQIMAHDATMLVVKTVLAIIAKRKINNNDIADISAVLASDYMVALANLAWQKLEPKLIETQLAEVTA